jgi:hypothetical protein
MQKTSTTYTIDHTVGTIGNLVWHMTDGSYIVLHRSGAYRDPQPGEQVIVQREFDGNNPVGVITGVETPIGETLYVRP